MTTVLVVDDSPIDRRLAGKLLSQRADLSILYAADGEEGLRKIKHFRPDLVLTDMQMPDKTGLELVAESRLEFPTIPVILMTAQGSEELAVEALQRGAASYVPKRVLAQELLDTVARVLAAAAEGKTQSSLMGRLIERHESFTLENDFPLVMSVSHYLQRELAEVWQLDPTDRIRIGTALEEGLLNAVYHGNLEVSSSLKEIDHELYHKTAEERQKQRPYCERRVFVGFRLTSAQVEFTIRDEGPGFDPHGLPDPTDPANLERPSGRGVLLMRAFMDSVDYNDRGNEVRMSKRRFKERPVSEAPQALGAER